MLACVVIPVYKRFEDLTYYEITALKQVFQVLSQHDLCFLGPKDHDFEGYLRLAKMFEVKVTVKVFAAFYFIDVHGYNKLLKSFLFYDSFSDYNYLLIYQLDAYVFRDELTEWCHKGYDYIGAPWIQGWNDNTSDKIIGVGNGGFSLHNIKTALKVLPKAYRLSKFLSFIKKLPIARPFLLKFTRSFMVITGLRVNRETVLMMLFEDEDNINEDYFWGKIIPIIFKDFKVARVEDAIKFSFEVNPQLLYTLNHNRLPFGCHAWMKYDLEFWKPFIFNNYIKCSSKQ